MTIDISANNEEEQFSDFERSTKMTTSPPLTYETLFLTNHRSVPPVVLFWRV